jgi:hypothetical protein
MTGLIFMIAETTVINGSRQCDSSAPLYIDNLNRRAPNSIY